MATSKKRHYRTRICTGCGKEEQIRIDVKAQRCRACASAARRVEKPPKKPPVVVNPGEQFNHLTAIREEGRSASGQKTFLCQCDCGKQKVVPSYELRTGAIKSCGHLVVENRNTDGLADAEDLTGSTNGFLQFISDLKPLVKKSGRKERMIRVLCRACKTESDMEARNYRRFSSCGCMKSVIRRHVQPAYEGGYACPCCKETKDESEFHWSMVNGRRRKASYCKPCTRKKQKAAYEKRTGKVPAREPERAAPVQANFAPNQGHIAPWARKEERRI